MIFFFLGGLLFLFAFSPDLPLELLLLLFFDDSALRRRRKKEN